MAKTKAVCQTVRYKKVCGKAKGCIKEIWKRGKKSVCNEEGLGTIELVLLICVLIALALMFKDTIVEFVSDILGNISSQETVFDPGTIAQ